MYLSYRFEIVMYLSTLLQLKKLNNTIYYHKKYNIQCNVFIIYASLYIYPIIYYHNIVYIQ